MTIQGLHYTPSNSSQDHPHTMVLMVDGDAYKEYQHDKNSIPMMDVLNSFQVMKYQNPGRSGCLERPSKRELQDVFGFTNEDKVAEFMLEHGELSGRKM